MAIEKETLNNKGIENLYHFTNVKNINSIMENGILSRNELDKIKEELDKIEYECFDNDRADCHKDYISLSIEHHNYKMLHSRYPCDKDKENMAILELDTSILTEENIKMKCSVENAACNSGANIKDLNEENFNELYYTDGRADNLNKKYPTNPQAEILIKDKIDSKYIKNVYFYSEEAKKGCGNNSKYQVDKYKYCPRPDYKHWQEKNNEE